MNDAKGEIITREVAIEGEKYRIIEVISIDMLISFKNKEVKIVLNQILKILTQFPLEGIYKILYVLEAGRIIIKEQLFYEILLTFPNIEQHINFVSNKARKMF